MCQRLKIAFIALLISFFLFSPSAYTKTDKQNDYPVLEKAYSWGIAGGASAKYFSKLNTVLTSVIFDTEFMVIDTFGLNLTNAIFVNNKKDFFFGDNLSLSINVRPLLAMRFIKNRLSKNYYWDYFYHSFSINFGGTMQYTKFSKNKDSKNIFTLGTKIGASFAVLMHHDKASNFYLKTSLNYNFLQDVLFHGNIYNMSGVYLEVVFGISFRFGDNIDWLVGTHENDEKIDIRFKE